MNIWQSVTYMSNDLDVPLYARRNPHEETPARGTVRFRVHFLRPEKRSRKKLTPKQYNQYTSKRKR